MKIYLHFHRVTWVLDEGVVDGPSLCIEGETFKRCNVEFDAVDQGAAVEIMVHYDFEYNQSLVLSEECGYLILGIKLI